MADAVAAAAITIAIATNSQRREMIKANRILLRLSDYCRRILNQSNLRGGHSSALSKCLINRCNNGKPRYFYAD